MGSPAATDDERSATRDQLPVWTLDVGGSSRELVSACPARDVSTASPQRGSRPVGQALASAEDRQVKSVQAEAKQARSQPAEERQTKEIERLSIELDGVLARMRRGSVPMEKEERQRKGDVYREIKAGAVFRAERGSKRSELVPGVYVDTPAPESVRYVARRTAKGGFGWLLYQLAVQC